MNIYLIVMIICAVLMVGLVVYFWIKRKDITYEAIIRKAEKGSDKAQTILGFMYHSGNVFPKDTAKAIYWFEKAAAQGNSEAQFLLGGLYIEGISVAKDHAKGAALITASAESGYRTAQLTLANMFAEGRCVERDLNASVKWFVIAAVAGDITAQKTVAGIYNFTVGFDRKIAYAWYMTAAQSQDVYAKEMADKLFDEFTQEERDEASSLAIEYISKYYIDKE